MSMDRREFLRWTGVAAVGAAVSVTDGCAEPQTAPPAPPKPELLTVGLYSWAEIVTMPTEMKWLNLAHARLGGVLTDEMMAFCLHHNIEILLNVTPATARTSFDTDAAFIAAYLAQIDFALTRYGPRGTFWSERPTVEAKPVTQIEICNEPNFGYGFSGTDAEVANLYARVLIAAYGHIKARWPEVLVVGISAGGASGAAPEFVRAVLQALRDAGQPDSFDVVSIHPYGSDQPPDQVITENWGRWVVADSIDDVKQRLRDFGSTKPVWITEVGYQISQADGGLFPVKSVDPEGRPETVTLTEQAAYSIRMSMAAARHDIARVYYMSALDSDYFNGGWFGYTHEARPVATAMRQAIELLSGATNLEVVLEGTAAMRGGPYAYRFTTPRGDVLVAWSEKVGNFKLPTDGTGKTRVTDMLGDVIAEVTGDSYQAALSASPIFLTSLRA